jgi:hypothetical protein
VLAGSAWGGWLAGELFLLVPRPPYLAAKSIDGGKTHISNTFPARLLADEGSEVNGKSESNDEDMTHAARFPSISS